MTMRDRIEERAYCVRRARVEREMAARCEDNGAALAHLQMADEYDRRSVRMMAKIS